MMLIKWVDEFKFQESLVLIDKAIEIHNKATGYQEAAKFFLKNCYKVEIIYDEKRIRTTKQNNRTNNRKSIWCKSQMLFYYTQNKQQGGNQNE